MAQFLQLQQQVFALYGEKKYAQALEVIQQALPQTPDYAARLTDWQACLLCLQGQPDQALKVLQGGLEQGLWFSRNRLTGDPDLAAIQERPELKAILEESERRKQAAQAQIQPKLRVFAPKYFDEKTPLLMAFHMKGANLEDTVPHWLSAVDRGVFLALLQSGQLEGPNEYCWDNFAQAEQEAKSAFAVLKTQHPFNPDYVVLGGASQGAGLALRLALQQTIPAKGFIAVVGAPNPEAFLPHFESAVQKGVKGVFITGDQDRAKPLLENVYEQLHSRGLECRLEVIPNLGHDYPVDMPERLERALRFIIAA
ncbi:MAG: hypothetical protein IVW51_01655 [Thermaceae bacterium]|nr:hypothetical protein [Thermaceae bacterium]